MRLLVTGGTAFLGIESTRAESLLATRLRGVGETLG